MGVKGWGRGVSPCSFQLYNATIQYNTTLFHYGSHTQQKLVSRWGVGKHVTIKYKYIFKIEVYYIESVRSNRKHEGRGRKFAFEIRKRSLPHREDYSRALHHYT